MIENVDSYKGEIKEEKNFQIIPISVKLKLRRGWTNEKACTGT